MLILPAGTSSPNLSHHLPGPLQTGQGARHNQGARKGTDLGHTPGLESPSAVDCLTLGHPSKLSAPLGLLNQFMPACVEPIS